MKRILCTCPPMIAAIERFDEEFIKRGAVVICPEFQQEMTEEDLIDILPSYDGWIIGDCPVSEKVLRAGKSGKLKAAVRWGIGTDNVDFVAAEKLGYIIHNTPGVFNEEVSDVALGYGIGLVRHLFEINQGVRDGKWPKPAGRSLNELKVGVLGYGNIGRATCRKYSAIGCEVYFSDPLFNGAPDEGHMQLGWPELIEDIDILVVTCAMTDTNRHLVDVDQLSIARDGLILINVARGGLVSEKALVEALESGKVQSAALDVLENEPLALDNPLLNYSQVVFGSHNGSNTVDAVDRTSRLAINLLFEEL